MTRRLLLIAGASVLVLLAAGAGHARQAAVDGPHWVIHDLGTLPGPYALRSEADKVNDAGAILGWSGGAGPSARAVLWRHGGRRVLQGSWSLVTAMNRAGDVVGIAPVTHDARGHLFLWRHDGSHVDLTSRDGIRGEAADINDRGAIVGQMDVRRATHAFLWRNGRVTDLGTLGGKTSSASAINNAGEIVGESQTATGHAHAFLWADGRIRDLGTLPGESSRATSINDRGEIVGIAHVGYLDGDHVLLWKDDHMRTLTGFGPAGGLFPAKITNHGAILVNSVNPDRAYLWRKGKAIDLGSLGSGRTHAADLNEKGQVVGSSRISSTQSAAFVWSQGRMTALPNLTPGAGPPWSNAAEINARGEIVGGSYVGRISRERAVFWTLRR